MTLEGRPTRRELLRVGAGAVGAACLGLRSLAQSGVSPRAWYRSDRGVFKDTALKQPATATGDRVALWRDLTGNRLHLVQPDFALRPSLRVPALNGYPSLRFSRAGQRFLQALRTADWTFLHSGEVTVFVVWRTFEADPVSTMTLVATGASESTETGLQFAYVDQPLKPPSDGMVLRTSNGSGYAYQVSQPYGVVIPRVFSVTSACLRPDSAGFEALIESDGAFAKGADRTGPLSLAPPAAPLTVGRDANAQSSYLEGEIVEIVIFDQALTETARADMTRSLAARYALPGVTYVKSDGAYNAFPGFAQVSNGGLLVAYRKGATHGADRGRIVATKSNRRGSLWTTEKTIVEHPTFDVRDACLSRLRNGHILLTYHERDLSIGRSYPNSCRIARSTDDGYSWQPSIPVSTRFELYAFCSAPVCEAPSEVLYFPVCGRDEAGGACRVMISLDGGYTWPREIEIANALADGRTYIEPNIVAFSDNELLCLIRTSERQIYSTRSTDGGETWSAPVPAFVGRGSPRMLRLASRRLICIHRSEEFGTANRGVIHVSEDNGQTWSADEQILDATQRTFVYSAAVELSPGQVGMVYSVEQSATVSEIRFRRRSEETIRLAV